MATVFYHNRACEWIEWIEKFKNILTNVMLEDEAECLSMFINEDTIESSHDMVLLDRQATTDEANCLKVSNGSANKVIHCRLGHWNFCARWVPEQLTLLHEQMCLDI
jgi:hypothetical protein